MSCPPESYTKSTCEQSRHIKRNTPFFTHNPSDTLYTVPLYSIHSCKTDVLQFMVVVQSINQFVQDQHCSCTLDLEACHGAIGNGLQGCLGVGRGHIYQTTCGRDEMGVVHASEQLSHYPIHVNGRRGVGERQDRE